MIKKFNCKWILDIFKPIKVFTILSLTYFHKIASFSLNISHDRTSLITVEKKNLDQLFLIILMFFVNLLIF